MCQIISFNAQKVRDIMMKHNSFMVSYCKFSTDSWLKLDIYWTKAKEQYFISL